MLENNLNNLLEPIVQTPVAPQTPTKPQTPVKPRRRSKPKSRPGRSLVIDIGGMGIKTMVLSANGKPLTKRTRVKTPRPATPGALMNASAGLAKAQGAFDRVSVGFPGVVRRGVVVTAPNLDGNWRGLKVAEALAKKLGKPVRVANDADMQGFGVITGHGVELAVTLGTGFGSGLFVDGKLVPNLEIAHHPYQKGKTYEELLGDAVRKKIGKKKWNKRLVKAIKTLERTFNYDRLYLGGGNAMRVTAKLPSNVKLVSNAAGLHGGLALWRD